MTRLEEEAISQFHDIRFVDGRHLKRAPSLPRPPPVPTFFLPCFVAKSNANLAIRSLFSRVEIFKHSITPEEIRQILGERTLPGTSSCSRLEYSPSVCSLTM